MKSRSTFRTARIPALGLSLAGMLFALSGCMFDPPGPKEKLPFLMQETLESIREKIAYNGYTFTVEHNYEYNKYGKPDSMEMPDPYSPAGSGEGILQPNTDVILAASGPLPSSFDWRNHGGHSYIGPIRDQGDTGVCYAFGAIAAAETAYNFKYGLYDKNRVELSEMYLLFTAGSTVPYSSHYGAYPFPRNANQFYELYALTRAGSPQGTNGLEGACARTSFAFDPECYRSPPTAELVKASKNFRRYTFKRWARIFPENYADTTEQIKRAIMSYGSVDANIHTNAAFIAYKSGVYEDTLTQPDVDPSSPYFLARTTHAISLVGWDDNPPEGGGGCWILRNEWGTAWGEKGYMRIRYFSARVNARTAFIEAGSSGPYMISGTVTHVGLDLSGASLSLTGSDTFVVISDNSGIYGLTGLVDGNYTVTPRKTGYSFEPASRDVTVSGGNVTGCDFVATEIDL